MVTSYLSKGFFLMETTIILEFVLYFRRTSFQEANYQLAESIIVGAQLYRYAVCF